MGRGDECKGQKVPQEQLSRSYERHRRDDAVFAALDSRFVQPLPRCRDCDETPTLGVAFAFSYPYVMVQHLAQSTSGFGTHAQLCPCE